MSTEFCSTRLLLQAMSCVLAPDHAGNCVLQADEAIARAEAAPLELEVSDD